jgi:hypothetical protein
MRTASAAAVDNLLRAMRDLVEDDISGHPLTQDLVDLINCLVATVTSPPTADDQYVGRLLDRLRTRSNEAYESFCANSAKLAAEQPGVARGVSACVI